MPDRDLFGEIVRPPITGTAQQPTLWRHLTTPPVATMPDGAGKTGTGTPGRTARHIREHGTHPLFAAERAARETWEQFWTALAVAGEKAR